MEQTERRHFVAYGGVKLPLRRVNPLAPADIANRNTCFCAYCDMQQRMVLCQKDVYGEVEFEHRYEYPDNGSLRQAGITEADDEPKMAHFDEQGASFA